MKMINQDTICAIATAQGGAIGIIRVSGPKAIEITSRIFTPATGKPLTERAPYTLTFGKICSPKRKINNTLFQQTSEIPQEKSETLQKTSSITSSAEEVIDEVLISLFRAPHSYTGEDSTEIMCHGSSYILQQVIQLLIYNGCRAALPGEYTQRAFLNGKMDLSQAEAVADLIASSSASTHRLAMSQMRGGFSKELSNLRNQLLHFTSLMELELDFSDHEELEFANRDELSSLATHIEQVIARLAHSFSVGNAIKNGIPVAIIGETNAGKSTLLNALLNEEKAIVSDIHGTTRAKGVMLGDEAHIFPGQFGILGFNLNPMYKFNRFLKAGISLDGPYDESANIYSDEIIQVGEEPRFYRPPLHEQIGIGLSARGEFTMPFFSINIGVGHNLFYNKGDLKGLYQILALKVSVTRNLFLHVGYQLHKFHNPNNLMLGVGYRFHN